MCPEWRFDHIVKDTVFTDCSAPRNLQPLGHFRKTYPGPKGDNDSDDDENNETGGEGTSFGATDPYESIPLHESTRIGETDESSMNSRNKWTMQTKPVKMFLDFKILIQHFGLILSEAKQRTYY